jgi:hypothetical protein
MLDFALPLPTAVRFAPRSELQVLEARLWSELRAASAQRGHPWRTAVLATCDDQGFPDARSVVLREVQPESHELKFYTDTRSPKVAQLRRQPRATLVVWSAELGWQLRMALECQVRTSGLEVLSRWAQLKLTPAAQDYLSPLPPGSPLHPVSAPSRCGREAPDCDTREHFAVVNAKVLRMDWLSLDPSGHQRACFEADQPARWLQP